ncbi:triacylglycerol lipase 2-like isoform X2 [Phaseolus vulgaris]|uniref:triacylglycerol lipase 2-like isoform X2 n=1 Tax=Phaseolus vulgaris TaxID=3885 RepID=UPI0035CB2823
MGLMFGLLTHVEPNIADNIQLYHLIAWLVLSTKMLMHFYGQQFCLVLLIISDLDWNWSWDELVAHDLPVTFKYVHDLTGQKLHYVGHAQGTLIALADFSQDQLFNILRSTVLLSPIAYQMTSPLAKNAAENIIFEVDGYCYR